MPDFGTLVILRHGESAFNAEGRFTGLLDPPLTGRGRTEAEDAARELAVARLLPIKIFTSTLLRATETADIVARSLEMDDLPERLWRLNERNYGALTGRSKSELWSVFGEELLHRWRRTLHGTPPPMNPEALERLRNSPALVGVPPKSVLASESLFTVSKRINQLWLRRLCPLLLQGETVLCVGHGNSLRALCLLLDGLSDAEVEGLNIPTGQPLVYRFDCSTLPVPRGGRYLNPLAARTAAERVAAEGGT